MKMTKTGWAVVAFLSLVALGLVLPALPEPSARAQRIQTVNHMATASSALPGTNTLRAIGTNR